MLTKSDLKNMSTIIDQKLEQKLRPVQKTTKGIQGNIKKIQNSLRNIQSTLNLSIKLSENQHKRHFQRLTKIEEKLDIEKSDFVSPN